MKRFFAIIFLVFVIFLFSIYRIDLFEQFEKNVENVANFLYDQILTMIDTVEEFFEGERPDWLFQEKEQEKPLLDEPKEQVFSVLNIEIGSSFDEVESQLGAPKRFSYNEYGTHWYTYHENYNNFLKIMFNEEREVAALFTNQDIFTSKNGIKLGSSKEEVKKILGPPLTRIQKGLYHYQLRGDEDYQVYLIDGNYVTIFYDKHANDTVSGILIISKEMEEKKENLYGAASLDLRDGFEYQLYDLTNATRVRFNLAPLKWDEYVRQTARDHSIDMAENNYFNHTNLEGKSPFDRMREDRIHFTLAGENLAYGQFNSIFAHEGLMNSKGHRENILHPKYESVGIGVAFNSHSQPFFTQKFYRR